MPRLVILVIVASLISLAATAAETASPYSGQEQRAIKALSESDIKAMAWDWRRRPSSVPDFGATFATNSRDDTVFIGGGIGYQFTNWLRADVTGKYRAAAGIAATELVFNPFVLNPDGTHGSQQANFLRAHFSSAVFLANVYADFGTWWCLTPFVGAGAGVAFNRFTGLTDEGFFQSGAVGGFGFGDDATKTTFAWALHAGLAYNVSPNFKVELAYRYLNLGNVTTDLHCAAGGCVPVELRDITSQDIKLGFRWLLQPETPYVPPLITKG